ncbi:MAG: chromate resistance protein ChrB domain-containing protein [Vulcanimicrobiaceae bacterium]
MKFVTRRHARVDRIACPWLIRRFIDPTAEILFVPAEDVVAVAARQGAFPFDIPGVELGHHASRCSFDAFLDKFELDDPALQLLAEIVRGADTDERSLRPESAGLFAVASGFRSLMPSRFSDDHAMLAAESVVYDALYEYCKEQVRAASV